MSQEPDGAAGELSPAMGWTQGKGERMIFSPPYGVVQHSSLASSFHPNHWADLLASGLSEATIRLGKVYSLAPTFITHFFRRVVPKEIENALCFPYQGGRFARIKLFPGFRKMRYSQPLAIASTGVVEFHNGHGASKKTDTDLNRSRHILIFYVTLCREDRAWDKWRLVFRLRTGKLY